MESVNTVSSVRDAVKALSPMLGSDEPCTAVLVCNHKNSPVHAFSFKDEDGKDTINTIVERLNVTGLYGGEALVVLRSPSVTQDGPLNDLPAHVKDCARMKKELSAFGPGHLLLDYIVRIGTKGLKKNLYYSFFEGRTIRVK